jgi:hypothetical protein
MVLCCCVSEEHGAPIFRVTVTLKWLLNLLGGGSVSLVL